MLNQIKCLKHGKDFYKCKECNSTYALLDEVRESFNDLLDEAMTMYQFYPNNFRKTVEEYFKKEIEIREKLNEHFI